MRLKALCNRMLRSRTIVFHCKDLLVGLEIVLANKELLAETVSANKELLAGTIGPTRNYWPKQFRPLRNFWPGLFHLIMYYKLYNNYWSLTTVCQFTLTFHTEPTYRNDFLPAVDLRNNQLLLEGCLEVP